MKKTPELIAALRPFWQELQKTQKENRWKVAYIEARMREATGIEDLEFFEADGDFVGIGNCSRILPLIHDTELEEK